MFESIIFKPCTHPYSHIDIGALAESLLFYGKVGIVGNSQTLENILRQINPNLFLGLLRDKRIDFYYLTDIAAIQSQKLPDGKEFHNLVMGYMPSQQPDVVAGKLFRIASGNTKNSRQNAARFTDLIKPINHDGFSQDAALSIISTDATMVERSVQRLLNVLAPEYIFPSPPVFKIEKAENGIVVESNLDFTSLNATYNKSISSEISSLSDKLILSHLQESLITAHFSAKLNSEVAVNPLEQAIYSQAIESLGRVDTHLG